MGWGGWNNYPPQWDRDMARIRDREGLARAKVLAGMGLLVSLL